MRLTKRDIRVLNWIGEQLVINSCELTELLIQDAQKHRIDIGQHATAGLIARWKRHGLVASFHQLQRGSHLYLTKQGIQATGLRFRATKPGRSAFAHLTHHDAVNRLRLHLEAGAWQGGQELIWLSERRLLQIEREKNGEYSVKQKVHRPDAIVYLSEREQIAIEVERSYKRPKRLKAILTEYLYQQPYVQVRYYCSQESICQNLQRALTSLLEDSPLIHQTELQQKISIQRLPFDD